MMYAMLQPALAAVGAELPVSGLDTGIKQSLSGTVPVIIAALLILFGFITWAVFLRPSERRRQRGEILEGAAAVRLRSSSSSNSGSGSGRSRRRRREKGRPRNPTLAETGGLPPVRDPKAPPPGIP
jgi:peptidoglycan/LPS O-acetylase OafA/YrhL